MTRTTRALPATLTVRPLVVPTDTPHADLGDMRELVRLGNVVNRQDAGHPFFDELPEEVVPVWRDQRDTTRVGFFAQDDGTTVGALTIEMPNEPGAATAEFEIMVEPSRRGEGIEEGLLDVLEQTARDRGRSILQTWTLHPRDTTGVVLRSPTGFGAIPADDPQARFLQRHGFTFEQVERNSTLDLRADPAPIARTLENAKAFAGPDYEVIAWSSPTPREYADGFAYALSRMATDVPSAGMVWEEETWDAARIARRDARLQAAGNTVSVAGVRHLPSGRIVAFNELMIGRDHAGTTHQWGTLVLKEHRGHRLGTVVKCANLLRWREQVPESPRVSTFNAEENRPMLDINEAIGFVPASYAGAWKKVLS